jgi:hypothetical protein
VNIKIPALKVGALEMTPKTQNSGFSKTATSILMTFQEFIKVTSLNERPKVKLRVLGSEPNMSV